MMLLVNKLISEARCPKCDRLLFKYIGGIFHLSLFSQNIELHRGDSVCKCSKCRKSILVRHKSIA